MPKLRRQVVRLDNGAEIDRSTLLLYTPHTIIVLIIVSNAIEYYYEIMPAELAVDPDCRDWAS